MPIAQPVEERFWAKVEAGDCWVWIGRRDVYGYGVFKLAGKLLRAHRVAHELLVGPIPDGHEIDHLCEVRHCVNPDHFAPVTKAVHNARHAAKRMHCGRGHLLDGYRRQTRGGFQRYCKTCAREAARQYRERKGI